MKKYRYFLIEGNRVYPDDVEMFIIRTEGEKLLKELLGSGQPFEYEMREASTGHYRLSYSFPPQWQIDIFGFNFHFPYPDAIGKELSKQDLKECLKGMKKNNRREEEEMKSFFGL